MAVSAPWQRSALDNLREEELLDALNEMGKCHLGSSKCKILKQRLGVTQSVLEHLIDALEKRSLVKLSTDHSGIYVQIDK